jgi:hypothetical protein
LSGKGLWFVVAVGLSSNPETEQRYEGYIADFVVFFLYFRVKLPLIEHQAMHFELQVEKQHVLWLQF